MFIPRVPCRHQNLLAIAILLSLALTLSGCNKQRANWYLKNAQKRLQLSQQNEAQRFSPQEMKGVEDKVKETQGNLAGGQNDVALESARQASELSKQLLESTKMKRAQTLKTEADQDVKIATENQGNQIDPVAFQRIQDKNAASGEALGKQKYEKSIKLSLEVANEVAALLQSLKEQAQAHLNEVKKGKERMLREEAAVEAPGYVTDVDKKIAEMEQLINQERLYKKADQVYRDTLALIEDGITKALLSRSQKKIASLEKKLVRAINEEAPLYTPDLLETSQQQYQDILKNFYPPIQDYRKVLDMANLLEPQLDELILQTRILASQAQINAVNNSIRMLEGNNVRTYLPGRLEKIEELRNTADEQFRQQQYDECKKTCKIALEEKDQVIKAFTEFTASEIRAASARMDEANSVLEQMGDIFSMQSPTTDDSVEQSFEKGKQALRAVLVGMGQEARILIGTATVQMEDGKFSNAIENARLAHSKSNYIIRETFHTVAHNNVLEVANKITQVNLNGGAKFAQPEVANAKALLEEARGMIREEEAADQKEGAEAIDPEAYKPAVSKTSEAKAALEVSIQRITASVMDKVSEAKKIAETAESNQAAVYALGDLSTARQVIQQSNDLISKGSLFDAATKAEQGKQIAMDANVKALRGWAQDAIATAENELAKGEKAGSDHYSAERYKEALNRITTAKTLFQDATKASNPEKEAKLLAESKDLALGSGKEAVASRMAPITKANQEIVKARNSNAWEENYPLLMQSIIDVRNALEAMEAGNFNRAKAYADKAARTAQVAADKSERKTLEKQISKVSANLQEAASGQGGLFFNLEGIRKLAYALQQIKENAKAKEFETIRAQLDRFETELFKLVQDTPEIFKKVVDQNRAVYNEMVKRGAKEFASTELTEAERRIRFAEVDFNQGNFRSSYENLKKAAYLLNSVDIQYKEREFINEVHKLLAQLTENIKNLDPILKIPPATMHRVLDQPQSRKPVNALFEGTDPVEFSQNMDDLYKKSLIIPFPATMVNQRKLFVEVFDLSRQAGFAFEKFLILDQYDKVSAKGIVDKAYILIEKARKQQESLTSQIQQKGLQGHLAILDRDIGVGR